LRPAERLSKLEKNDRCLRRNGKISPGCLANLGICNFSLLGSFLAHLLDGIEDLISIMGAEQLHSKSNVTELLAQAQKPAMERGVIAPIE
jgi:hypothetical protein